ncbi:MAG: hypothetical protein ACR2PX_10560 [Endozoicomonas sp.]|uniref:hypothetical protein n=1 Tax=Endozoicomonas sp. TaxID=1892382 RepID=UPI003D9B5E71
MSNEKKSNNALSKEKAHYNEKFIATKENRQKVKDAFDKSRDQSMKGKFDGVVEV